MSSGPRSVVVAALTYRRPQDLFEALPQLLGQASAASSPDWTVRVLIVDNDPDGGARQMVIAFASENRTGPSIDYMHEPVPGITAGRNRALTEASDDDILVFIDDDERPSERWLELLLTTYARNDATAVVGPVVSEYEEELSPWMLAGRFFDRRRMPTDTPILMAATNNLLLDLHEVRRLGLSFDPRFGISGGGDSLFTLQLVQRGGTMVWCDEAVVVDVVPASRSTRRWVLTRAFRSGNHWVRTHLEVADTAPRRLSVRLRALGRGTTRSVGGSLRWLVGAVSMNLTHQAKGARTAARGFGMLAALTGYMHHEYRRKPVSP